MNIDTGKNKKRMGTIIAVAVLVTSAAGLVYYYTFNGSDGEKRAIQNNAGPLKAAKSEQLYTCGMHPQVIQKEPGSCPICGMDLVPMSSPSGEMSDHNHDANKAPETGKEFPASVMEKKPENFQVKVEPSVIQKMGVRTEILKKKKISREIRAVAHVDFNEEKVTIINSRVTGWIEKLFARYTGQSIKKGSPLASIYSPELVSTQEEYLQLYRAIQSGDRSTDVKNLFDTVKKRLYYWRINESQIRKIEKNDKPDRFLTITSPYSGVVIEKNVIEGAHIAEGQDLFKIADLSIVWAYVHISEKDIPFVSSGMRAEMVVSQLPGRVFSGRVSFIFPYMNEKTRDLKIRVSFPNSKGELRPGMYATLILKKDLSGEHLVAPSSAIIRTGSREIAFVYKGDGIFEPRELKTGFMDGENGVQILQGLNEGEAIVLSGQFLFDSESRIQEAVRKHINDGSSSTKSGPSATVQPGGHNH